MPISGDHFWQNSLRRLSQMGNHEALGKLGDFTTTPRMLFISGLALIIGIVSAFVALILLKLIGLFTNLFFYQRWSTTLSSPAGNHLGLAVVIVPIIGALIIGFMARYGSERIRGHGIPEAIEAILINGSKMKPGVALLKPISAAISIGSGGPFGAEGPIIMTGGAVGSMIAQFIHLSSTERKILLVAGAAGGMSAIFAAPIASILLGVELLLFEWKPRSLVPVALASASAVITRYYLLGQGPIFPTAAHPAFIGIPALLCCILVGLLAGVLAMLLTMAVYTSEDLFHRLPIHWMWWPALGGLVIGIGGLIFPPALGVGYDVIGAMLQGNAVSSIFIGILVVKSLMWAISLGSGTSGGVLAPLLMIGGALGGLEAMVLPNEGAGFWVLISMAAVVGGTMRAPFTAIIFAVELTHDFNALLPLMIAVSVSYTFTVLVMRRSILTEKISRRGYHISAEYAIDPLEVLFVREVMSTDLLALPVTTPREELEQVLSIDPNTNKRGQRLYPIVDEDNRLLGIITRRDLQQFLQMEPVSNKATLLSLTQKPVVAYPDETLRHVANRMAESGHTRLPVVERDRPQELLGLISLQDLLKGRVRNLEEERQRERILFLRRLLPIPVPATKYEQPPVV
jgi:chloride channel protein, CIC family